MPVVLYLWSLEHQHYLRLVRIQIFGSHFRLTEPEILGMGPSNLGFTKPLR